MKLRENKIIDEDTREQTFIDNDGGIVVKRQYDTANLMNCIRHNKEFAARGKDLYHIASLPLELIEHWRQNEGFDWFSATEQEKKERLNHPDNRAFRIMEVKL